MELTSISAPITFNETSPAVANLQAALTALGFTVSTDEMNRQSAGQSTIEAIRNFQSQNQIPVDTQVLIDEATAATLNRLLKDRQLLPSAKTYTVSGRVLNGLREPIGGKSVLAYDVDLRGARFYRTVQNIDAIRANAGLQPLGSAVSRADGTWSISFTDAQFAAADLGLADVIVYAVQDNVIVGQSSLSTDGDYTRGISLQNWDVILSGTADRGVSEFTKLLAAIDQLLKISRMAIGDLYGSDDQVSFLATETKQDPNNVRLLVSASQLAVSFPNNPEAHQLLYGLGREKVTLSFSAISLTGDTDMLTAWQQAAAENIIDVMADEALQAFLEVLHSTAVTTMLSTPPNVGAASLLQTLQLTTNDTKLQSAFISANRTFSGTPQDFWNTYLPSLPELAGQPQLIKSFQLTNQLTALTNNFIPLVEILQTEKKIQNPADLLSLSDQDWNALLTKSGIPSDVTGNSDADKLTNYQERIQALLNAAYPTQKIAAMVSRGQLPFQDANIQRGLTSFFLAATDFDISSSRISDFSSQLNTAGGENKDILTQALSRLQRLYAISPTPDSLSQLAQAGFYSANQVANIPQQAFIDMQAANLGGENIALAVHQRASFQTMRLEKLIASINEMTNLTTPQAVLSTLGAQQLEVVIQNNLPNWTALFGSPDICECDECRSVYGAAAYLVDILQFLNGLSKNFNNQTPQDVLFQRRPDIAFLPLTCENTNTIIPYIDLVNEVLEYYVANGALDNNSAYDTGDATSDELRANPQNTLKAAYNKVNNAKYPFQLPYHQPLDVERIYYYQLQTTRAEVMTVLQKDFSPPTKTAIDAELLQLSQEEYQIWTTKDFAGNTIAGNTRDFYGVFTDDNDFLSKIYAIPAFLSSTGLAYTDVVNMLDTNFINPGQPILDYIEDLFTTSTLSSSDVYQKLKAIAGGADPSADQDIMTVLDTAHIAPADFSTWVKTNFPAFQNIITSYQSTSACDLGSTQLKTLQSLYEGQALSGISMDTFSKIHRFIRVWNKLQWNMFDLDTTLSSLGEETITDTLVGKLTAVNAINTALNIPLNKLATLWGNIQTTGATPLYNNLFLSRTIRQIDPAFQPDPWGAYLSDTTVLLKDHLAAIQAAFRVSGEDLALIFTDTALPADTSILTIGNLSVLYRYVVLAKALRVAIADLIALKGLFGINPFSLFDTVQQKFANIDPQASLNFILLVASIQASGFSVSALNYIIADIANPQQNLSIPDNTVQGTMLTVRKGFAGIENDDSDSDLLTNITEDLLRSKMQLIYQPDIVNTLISILSGTAVFTTMTDKNIPVTIPAPVNAYVNYILGSGRLQCTGVLSDNDKNLLTNLGGATSNFQAAVQALYLQPEQFLKDNFSTLFGAGMTDALANLLNHPAQVSPLDEQGKLNWFYKYFLPYLKNQLRRNVVVQTMAAVTGMDEPTAQVLLQPQVDALVQTLARTGLTAVYYKEETFTAAGLTRTDIEVDFDWGTNAPDLLIPADDFSVRWQGYVNPPATGDYTLVVEVAGAGDAFKLYVDNQLLLQKNAGDAILSWEDEVTLSMNRATQLTLEYVTQTGAAGIHLRWKTDTTPTTVIDTTNLYPADLYADLQVALKKFLKASVFIIGFQLNAVEVAHFIQYNSNFSAIDFGSLTKDHWQRIFNYTILRKSVPVSSTTFTDLFGLADRNNPTPALSDVLSSIVAATGWNADTLSWLVSNQFNFSVTDFRNEIALLTLLKAVQLVQKTGVAASVLAAWSATETDFDKLYDQSQEIKKAVKAKYEDDDWLTIAGKLSDILRQDQRTALVQFLLVQPELIKWGVIDADSLYEYFLIDVQMCSCMDTSRIVQATAAVQLFVTRSILNLESRPDSGGHETGVQPNQIDQSSKARWQWMQYYRVWEANRQVFLYPENWLDPSLRDDKSSFFQELESELLQNDITTASVNGAFYNYLDKLDEVSHLDICGVFQENDDNGALTKLHVFGRTHRKPYIYYYRTCDQYWHWSAWDKVATAIQGIDNASNGDVSSQVGSGVHLTPVVWKDRLFIFWPEFVKKQPSPDTGNESFKQAGDQLVTDLPASPFWEITLAWSEFKNGKWAPKNISKESINPSELLAQPTRNTSNEVWPEKFEPDLKHYSVLPQITAQDQLYLSLMHNGFDSHGKFILSDMHNPVGIEYVHDKYRWTGEPSANGDYTTFFMQLENKDALKLKGNIYLQSTPDHKLIFSPQFTDFEVSLQYPFFYSDDNRSYFVRSHDISFHKIISVLQDPTVSKFIGADVAKEAEGPSYIPKPQGDPAIFAGGAATRPVANSVASIPMLSQGAVLASPSANYKFIPPSFGATKTGHQYLFNNLFRTEIGLTFYTNYHPYCRQFLQAMNTKGLDGLMECNTTLPDDGGSLFESTYLPNHILGLVEEPSDLASFTYYKENVAFDEFALYGSYNWELFYHAPLYIATRLSNNGKYQEAMDWFHYIFDPTTNEVATDPNFPEARYWKVLPFKTTMKDSLLDYFQSLQPGKDDPHIDDWKEHPFDPFRVARDRPMAFMKNVVMKYIDNLVAWGDDLFRTDTRENINSATQLYIMAAHILGPRPQMVPSRGKIKAETYQSLKGKLDAFSNAMVDLENLFPYTSQVTTTGDPYPGSMLGVGSTLYFCIPDNANLLQYWDTVADRLFKIRHCMNIDGVERSLALFAPPIDPGLLVRAIASGLSIGSILADLNSPAPLYRFTYLVQKATEFCAEVKVLGNSILAALEKKEGEELQRLRAGHETAVLNLMTQVKQRQILEAQANLQSLQKSRETLVEKIQYYLDYLGVTGFTIPTALSPLPADIDQDYSLPDTVITDLGLTVDVKLSDSDTTGVKIIPKEKEQLDQAQKALNSQLDSIQSDILSGFFALIPDFGGHATPLGVGMAITFGGKALSWMASSDAKQKTGDSASSTHQSSRAATMAGFIRRDQDATHQANQALRELVQLDKQSLAAEIRYQIAQKELDVHQKQIDNAQDIEDYLQNQLQGHTKFTTQEFYQWLKEQLFAVYKQSYQMAFDMARKAEKAYQFELGVSTSTFIQYGYFDSTYQGLTAGEQLHLAIKQLEKSYIEQNNREFELTKHISMVMTRPDLLLQLKQNGSCEWPWPEEMFDLDYPGHYFRRIKSISISIPCVAGPYTTVNATLRLLSNTIRINTSNGDNGYEHNSDSGILTDDDRFVETRTPFVAIATSSAQNDSGVFELNFRDERYLPFEGAGVISRWKLELNGKYLQSDGTVLDISQFDFASISDIIVHARYTSREDAGQFRQNALKHLKDYFANVVANLQPPLMRLFSARQDMPTEWYHFLHPVNTTDDQVFALDLSMIRFPFYVQNKNIKITSLELAADSTLPAINNLQVISPDLTSDTVNLTGGGAFGALLHGSKDYTGSEKAPGAWVIKNPVANPRITEALINNLAIIIHYELS